MLGSFSKFRKPLPGKRFQEGLERCNFWSGFASCLPRCAEDEDSSKQGAGVPLRRIEVDRRESTRSGSDSDGILAVPRCPTFALWIWESPGTEEIDVSD